jgi:hypothetical protein
MSEEEFFRVTFVRPDGCQYETTGRASSEFEAVCLADEVLEHVEGIGIKDHLNTDGTSVSPPARLTVERVSPDLAGPGFGLVITNLNGSVIRK